MSSERADGQAAYEAYAGAVGWKAYNGENLKPWALVPTRIQNAWIEVGRLIEREVERRSDEAIREIERGDR